MSERSERYYFRSDKITVFKTEKTDVGGGLYKWYVLGLLSTGYIIGELGYFLIGTTSKSIAQDLHYGDLGCMLNATTGLTLAQLPVVCETVNSSDICVKLFLNETRYCEWDYNGLGMDYHILAGPAFMAIYTIFGVLIGITADKYNRSIILSICTLVFTLALLLMGGCTQYWHLVVLRMVLAAGESGCNPLASGIITDMFPEDQRALALSVYNWGTLVGFGVAFPVGRYISEADIWSMGWRMCYYSSGAIGMTVVLLTFLTLREPQRTQIGEEKHLADQKKVAAAVKPIVGGVGSYVSLETIKLPKANIFKLMVQPRMVLMCIVSTIRKAGGICFAYNADLYYHEYFPDADLSWWLFVISVIIGSIGVLAGGIISDKFVGSMGVRARLLVLAVSQLIATPFAYGSVAFNPLWAMVSLSISFFFAEMWLGNFYAVLVEIVPLSVRSTAVGVFLFIVKNISGNLPVVVDPVSKCIGYREALMIFYAGFYLISSVLFFVTMFLMPKAPKKVELEPEAKELMDVSKYHSKRDMEKT